VFPLNLYARVRISLCIIAHETAGAARTRSSLRPLLEGAELICKPRTKPCRENEEACFTVIARLDRATQYSRALMMNTNALEYWITRFRG
jgi:hypothetical protein